MKRKTIFALAAIGLAGWCACQNQGNKQNGDGADIVGKTWTDGLYFFTVEKGDSSYNCQGGSVHEGGIMFALIPAEEGFLAAKGNNGLAEKDSNYFEGYSFTGEEGDKFMVKVFDNKQLLIQYNKGGKAIGAYTPTDNINQTMSADIIRYLYSGEFTKEDGAQVVFDAVKPLVTGLDAEASTYEIQTVYDIPSGIFKLGNNAYNLERTDDGVTLQPVKQSKEDNEEWEDNGKVLVLKRVQGSEDQTGNVSKEVLTTTQLGYFSKGERRKMLDNLVAKGNSVSEIETINMQLLEALVANDME